MRSVCLTLAAALLAGNVVAQEAVGPTVWITFDDETCQITKYSGSASPLVLKKGEGVCLISPASETYRNAGIIVLEKEKPPEVILLPGISNFANEFKLPPPKVPRGKRTLLVLI
jgi:hypothetical protein